MDMKASFNLILKEDGNILLVIIIVIGEYLKIDINIDTFGELFSFLSS